MTIPSVGGNGNFENKVQINSLQPQEYKPSNTNSGNVKVDEAEYSIEKFKQQYNEIFHNKVLPIIEQYDAERKKRLYGAIIACVILTIIGIFLFLSLEGRSAGDAAGLCIGGAIALWVWLKKSFEKKVKRKIMPLLMKAFNGFYWQETPPVKHEEICEINIFPNAKNLVKSFDDCFVGKYRDVSVNLSECKYETGGKHSRTVFRGVVIKLKMNKNFEGITIIRPKNSEVNNFSDLKKKKMELVELEDVEFNKEYGVYSTDQIEARYLITTSFMERFKHITLAFSSIGSFCAFYGDSVYIAPYSCGDLFDLFGLTKPVTDTTQFEVLFEEFVSILALVDHFKLDKKLGL